MCFYGWTCVHINMCIYNVQIPWTTRPLFFLLNPNWETMLGHKIYKFLLQRAHTLQSLSCLQQYKSSPESINTWSLNLIHVKCRIITTKNVKYLGIQDIFKSWYLTLTIHGGWDTWYTNLYANISIKNS